MRRIIFFMAVMGFFLSMVSGHAKNFTDDYHSEELYTRNKGNVAGNLNGRITIVVFSDYFCLPCREENQILEDLVNKDADIRILYIEYPMLGDDSIFFAKGALAASYQNKYLPLRHTIMNSSEPLSTAVFFKIAQAQHLNEKELVADIDSKQVTQDLLNNMLLGNAFGILGLPTLIIGYTKSPHNPQVLSGINRIQLEATIKQMGKNNTNG